MKRVLMREIITHRKGGYLVPGGWTAFVPHFSADDEYVGKLTGMILPLLANHHPKAKQEAQDRCDELGRSEFLRRLEWFVSRQALEYARRFPHLVNPDRTLKGFDPEKLQHTFLPYNRTGRRGWSPLRKAIQEMAYRGAATMPVEAPGVPQDQRGAV